MSAYKPGARSQRDEAVDSLAAVWQLQEPSLWYLLGRKVELILLHTAYTFYIIIYLTWIFTLHCWVHLMDFHQCFPLLLGFFAHFTVFFTAPFLHFCFPPNFLKSLYLIWPICPFLFVIFPLSPQILEFLFSPQDSYSLILSCLWWSVCRSQFWKHFMIFFFFWCDFMEPFCPLSVRRQMQMQGASAGRCVQIWESRNTHFWQILFL